MIADGFLSHAKRRRTTAEIVVVSIAIGALAIRAIETPATPFGLLRLTVSVAAIVFVYFAPYQQFARRAFAVLAFEAIFGTLAFAFVDVPFVFDHQRQIGTLAVSIAESVDRFEHPGRLSP